jgi:hypothetical protein
MNRTELERKAKATAGQILKAKGYISMVDVLMAMGTLTKENYERWRFRQVPHLEKVLPGSLNKFQFLLRTLRSHARDELGAYTQSDGLYIVGQRPSSAAPIQQVCQPLHRGVVLDALRQSETPELLP